jgi:hypothetical protein
MASQALAASLPARSAEFAISALNAYRPGRSLRWSLCIMRRSPSIVPNEANQDTYLVLDDFGRRGCSWRETDAESADRETLIRDLVEGQYFHPVRIVAFNTVEGWSRDVTVDISDELRRRYVEFGEVSQSVLDFLDVNRR